MTRRTHHSEKTQRATDFHNFHTYHQELIRPIIGYYLMIVAWFASWEIGFLCRHYLLCGRRRRDSTVVAIGLEPFWCQDIRSSQTADVGRPAQVHDNVIKWKHFPRYWPFVRGIHRSPVNSPHKGQWRGASMFSLICAWINGWVNNREAGDLRRYHAHYDVTVMPSLEHRETFTRSHYVCITTHTQHRVDEKYVRRQDIRFIARKAGSWTIYPTLRATALRIGHACPSHWSLFTDRD